MLDLRNRPGEGAKPPRSRVHAHCPDPHSTRSRSARDGGAGEHLFTLCLRPGPGAHHKGIRPREDEAGRGRGELGARCRDARPPV